MDSSYTSTMKMLKLQILNFSEIGKILDYIHDQYFEKDNVRFDPENSILEIKFKKERLDKKELIAKKLFIIKKWNIPIEESILRIFFVENYQAEFGESFGLFNTIKYEEKENLLIITSAIPVLIKIKIKKFQIEIEDTGKVVDNKLSYSL